MSTSTFLNLLFLLLSAHFLADFTLQNDMIAIYKSRHANPGSRFGKDAPTIWPWVLSAHAFQHGALVFLITHSLGLGIAETLAHALTDFGKCEGWYGYHLDQCLHFGAKLIWIGALAYGIA